jgi:putative DNA methylase
VKKKLIEVALPLDKINAAAAKEKNLRHGHPSTLHLWWARRPLAACRAVLFASLVDDPSAHPDRFPTDEAQQVERDRLFAILEALVLWENSTSDEVLKSARDEIEKSALGVLPSIYDPFCGGGSIPLEAQRLGLQAHGTDLNPVAVLVTKALIEIPPKFGGHRPVNPEARRHEAIRSYRGAQGLADDVRFYGRWMRDRAWDRLRGLYPDASLPDGKRARVIAWIWARTVKCPNPACGAAMPLVKSYELAKKDGKRAWVEPVVDQVARSVSFKIGTGNGSVPSAPKIGRGAKFKCTVCGEPASDVHIKTEGSCGRMGSQLMAIVAQGQRGRIYLPPDPDHVRVAENASYDWAPDQLLGNDPRAIWCVLYGLRSYRDLFTKRQLAALSTFSGMIDEVKEQILSNGATPEYAEAVATYLSLAVSKMSDYCSTLCTWMPGVKYEVVRGTFARQGLPMSWDYAEANVFAESSGDFYEQVNRIALALETGPLAAKPGDVRQSDAASTAPITGVYCTDPPYYDNIGYADLSDYFYVWLRRCLKPLYPDLFATMLVPKSQELVATPYRFDGSTERARAFFEEGFGQAFDRMRKGQLGDYPLTVFYAFKQAESNDDSEEVESASTGWETMLEGLMKAGFQVTGTWPLRSERLVRSVAIGTNALASSIVLVCRPRPLGASVATEMGLQQALRAELPAALRTMQQESVAPVDLAQAAIGPGMAVYSRYSKVLGPDGNEIPVRRALEMINRVLDEVLSEQESEFDTDTRFALAWFQQYGMNSGTFGVADVLSRAMNIGVTGMESAGILEAKAGTVRLLKWEELPEDWDPEKDRRLTVWEMTHHMIRLMYKESDEAAARVLAKLGDEGEKARDLAYRLYQICERSKWSQEAQPYNALVVAWPNLTAEARRLDKRSAPEQMTL